MKDLNSREKELPTILRKLTNIVDAPLSEIYDFVIKELLSITNSEHAFFGHINGDKIRVLGKDVDIVGIWADTIRKRKAIIINNYRNYKGGLPSESPIKRLLSIPIFAGKKLIAVVVLTNKAEKYSEEDVEWAKIFLTVAQTIIERKKMEEALKESEEKYRLLAENITDGLFLAKNYKPAYVNSAFLKILGAKSFDEIREENLLKFLYPGDRKKIKKDIRLALEDKLSIKNYELKLKRIDGKDAFVELTLKKVVYKGEPLALGLVKDVTEKKRIEKALKESEEKYRTIVENAGEGICVDGEKEEIIFVNDAFANFLGYKKEELIGKSVYDIVYPEDIQKLREESSKRRKGVKSKYTLRLLAKDGSVRTFLISAIPIYKNGKFIGSLSINLDITKIRIMEEKFRGVFEGAMDAIFIEDLNGNIFDVNEAACKLLGYTKEELVGMNIANLVPEETKEKLPEIINEHLKKGGIRMEAITLHKNGSLIPVEVSTTVVDIAGERMVVAIVRDITERKKMEEKLEKEKKQLISIFEGIDEPIYVVDPNTYEILFANKTLKKWFGEDIIGKKCYKVFQNLDEPCNFCTNDKIFGKNFGKTHVWEFQNKRNNRWYRCIDRAIIWPDGRKVRMEIAIDITDRVKAEEKVRDAFEKEREFKLRTAHYFFNPIAIAKGYLSLALEEKDDAKIKKAVEAIERVERVVKNITQKGEIVE